MSSRPEMWLVLCGPPVPPFVVYEEDEAQTRANAGQHVWRIAQLERVLPATQRRTIRNPDTEGGAE